MQAFLFCFLWKIFAIMCFLFLLYCADPIEFLAIQETKIIEKGWTLRSFRRLVQWTESGSVVYPFNSALEINVLQSSQFKIWSTFLEINSKGVNVSVKLQNRIQQLSWKWVPSPITDNFQELGRSFYTSFFMAHYP